MSELYYAEMEAARNEIEKAYFAARPSLESAIETVLYHALFRAGYERAFGKMWNERAALQQGAPLNEAAEMIEMLLPDSETGECQICGAVGITRGNPHHDDCRAKQLVERLRRAPVNQATQQGGYRCECGAVVQDMSCGCPCCGRPQDNQTGTTGEQK